MQPHLKNDLLYLLRILEAAEKIILYAAPFLDATQFFSANDQKEFNACLNLLSQIGEQSNKLSNTLTEKYQQTDWVKIRGMRNRIVHDYSGVDLFITFDSIKKHIPGLKKVLSEIIRTELYNGNFDKEEFNIAQTSPYLRHVDFALLME
ncbi:MAG: HepT-like ribonuclease domain-containing protein [Chitinophagaceae bacterium]